MIVEALLDEEAKEDAIRECQRLLGAERVANCHLSYSAEVPAITILANNLMKWRAKAFVQLASACMALMTCAVKTRKSLIRSTAATIPRLSPASSLGRLPHGERQRAVQRADRVASLVYRSQNEQRGVRRCIRRLARRVSRHSVLEHPFHPREGFPFELWRAPLLPQGYKI